MSEADFQKQVLELCKHLGLLTYHTYDSRRSQPGFPDLVIVGRDHMLYRELKTDTGRVSAEQIQWLEALRRLGVDADVWRPKDWPTRVHKELQALGSLSSKMVPPSQAEIRKRLAKGSML
jgi:hypothetical protein